MQNYLLDIVAGTGDKAGNWYFDSFGEACIYALIGFLIVFAGIVLIILIIWLTGLLMRKTNNLAFLHVWSAKIKGLFKRRKKSEAKPEIPSVVVAEEISDEVKVAIMAAIMAYYSEQKPECEFKVKRIKRI